MGSPLNPNSAQYAALETAAVMQPQALAMRAGARGAAAASIEVPRQGVALVVIDAR